MAATGGDVQDIRDDVAELNDTKLTTVRADALDLLPYNDGRHVAVHYNQFAGNTGTVVGVDGTVDNPVSTEAAMLAIAASLGINTYRIAANGSTLTLTAAGSYIGALIYGDSPAATLFYNGQSVLAATLEDLNLSGDAGSAFHSANRCILNGVTNFAAIARECAISFGISSTFASGAVLINARVLASTSGVPTDLDMAGNAGSVTFIDFSGFVRIVNMNASVRVEMNLVAGHVEVASSCTAGDLILSGIATLLDGSLGTAVDAASLLTDVAISRSAYGGAVWIDTTSGNTGTTVGVDGVEGNPVDNFADAQAIAAAIGVKELRFRGTATLAAALSGFTVIGHGTSAQITLGSQDVGNTRFVGCQLVGTSGGGQFKADDCDVDSSDSWEGIFQRCWLVGTQTLAGGTSDWIDCTNADPSDLEFAFTTAVPHSLQIHRFSGGLELSGADDAGHVADVTLIGDRLTIGATNVLGSITASGFAQVSDTSGGATVDTEAVIRGDEAGDIHAAASRRNRIDFDVGPPRQLVFYERDNVTERFRADLTTVNGTEVLAYFGVQHERSAPVGTPVFSPLDLANIVSFWRADVVSLDTGPDPDEVTQCDDQVDAFDITSVSSSVRPSYTLVDPDGNGEPSMTFDGVDEHLKNVGAERPFTFMSDGTGGTLFIVFRSGTTDGLLVDNHLQSKSRIGFSVEYQGVNERIRFRVSNGGGVDWVVNVVSAGGSVPGSTLHLLVCAYGTSEANPGEVWLNNISIATAAEDAAPNLSDEERELHIGSGALPNEYFGGKIFEVGMLNSVATPAERAQLLSYSQNRYGSP